MHFDHVIHLIEETPQKAVNFWQNLSRNAIIGGRHEKWGTHNALLYGKNSYIEWLALENREVAESAEHPLTQLLLHDGSGFGTVCFRTASAVELDKRLTGLGYQTSGILDGSRMTADGRLIEWKMLFIKEEPSDRLPYPFFIEWNESDEERYESLRASGAMNSASASLELESCVFGVGDIEEATRNWTEILGGSLQLPNCRIEFREKKGKKERLEEVRFKNGKEHVLYEKGVYLI